MNESFLDQSGVRYVHAFENPEVICEFRSVADGCGAQLWVVSEVPPVFVAAPVPEPSTWALLLLGLVIAASGLLPKRLSLMKRNSHE